MHPERGTWNGMTYALCRVCGDTATSEGEWTEELKVRPDLWRCTRHHDRNPCVIEGCSRSRAAKGNMSIDHVICGEHWRRYIPPGSPGRRALNRLARTAKKLGYARTARWPRELEARWWRLWAGLVRRARQQSTEGMLDEAEINKLFGWDAEIPQAESGRPAGQ